MMWRLDRRAFLKAGTAALAGAALPGSGCAPEREGPPNVLLVLTDDLNAECVGFAGAGRVETPHLDSLAARGAVFEAAYCSAMPCTPSRGCIMAGRDWGRWERVGLGIGARLQEGEWTWAQALRGAGYDTALIGKMHFRPMRAEHGFATAEYCEHGHARITAPGSPTRDDYELWLEERGIVDWQNHRELASSMQTTQLRLKHNAVVWPYAEDHHPISWVRDRALAFLADSARRENPFALVVSFRYPHAPYNPVERFLKLRPPAAVELPDPGPSALGGLPSGLSSRLQGMHEKRWDEDASRRVLAFYYALVGQLDEAVGAILENVDLRRTLVVFTSDHGDYAGWRGLHEKRPVVPVEPLARVPLLAAGVGVRPGVRLAAPVALVDLAPTFLRLAGQPIPSDLDGVPLQSRYEAPSSDGDRIVGCVAPGGWIMVRRGAMKYLGRPGASGEDALFDLAEDPGERSNLASEPSHAAVREELAAAVAVRESPPHSTLSPMAG